MDTSLALAIAAAGGSVLTWAGGLVWRAARASASYRIAVECDARHEAERQERLKAEQAAQAQPERATRESLQGALAHVRHLEDRVSVDRTQVADRLARVETRLEAQGEALARIELGVTALRGGSGGRRPGGG